MSDSRLREPTTIAIILVTLGMAAAVGSALAFQYIGGYIPCALCYLQRQPYYIGLPVGVIGIAALLINMPPRVIRAPLIVIAILMLVGAGLGVYHSGVEWHFWEGPATCSTPVNSIPADAANLLEDINRIKGPSCTEAALRILGLSFAGWNVISSLILVAIAYWGIRGTKS